MQHIYQIAHLHSAAKVYTYPSEHRALADCSAYELALILDGKGFQWQEWIPPSRRSKNAAPLPIAYYPGEAQVWVSTPATFNKNYLIALCRSEELFAAGLQMVPHNATDEVYEKVLQGKFDAALLALRDVEADPPLGNDIEAEIEDDDALAICDVVEEEPVPEDIGRLSDVPSSEDSNGDDSDGSPTPLAPLVPPPEIDPPPPPPPYEESQDHLEDVASLVVDSCWGVFSIVAKNHGWQATCKFHSKSRRTGCKKWFPLLSLSKEDENRCLRNLLWWCLRHSDFTRQRDHVSYTPVPEDVPSTDFLDAMTPSVPPTAPVKTDEELDAEEAKGKGGKAKGRGGRGGGRGGRGKSKAKAKSSSAKAKAAAKPKATTSSGSTSSASSSSD